MVGISWVPEPSLSLNLGGDKYLAGSPLSLTTCGFTNSIPSMTRLPLAERSCAVRRSILQLVVLLSQSSDALQSPQD